MVDIASAHRQALDVTRNVVARITSDQLDGATPCDGWDVRTLLNHIVSGNWWAAELAAGKTIAEVGDRLDGDVIGTDLVGTYEASASAAAAAFEAPGALEAPCAVSYGPVPGEIYAGHRFLDVFVHGWDLLVATGQETTLDPALVEACIEVVVPQAELLAGSGMFGSQQHVSAGASPQTTLLAMLGRTG
ncbi:MAG: TIGR03086 family metal-binding protein [Acidimicrobiales bacterium]